jgi:hypothetical protein
MKYILGLIASILLLNSKAHAQICVSYFAAQAFTESQCNEALKVFNNVDIPCMAILWKTFTLKQNNTCTQEFFRRYEGKPHILAIHFSNEAGRRNRRLSRYEHLPKLSINGYNSGLERRRRRTTRSVTNNAKEIKHFIDKFANHESRILVSTGLEDNFSTEAFKVIVKLIREAIPNVEIIRNPVGDSEKYYIGADFIELHGVQPHIKSAGRCIQNLDGISIKFSDGKPDAQEILLSALPAFIKRGQALSCLVFLWWREAQGIGSKFIEPRKRKFLIEPKKINLTNNLIRRFQK